MTAAQIAALIEKIRRSGDHPQAMFGPLKRDGKRDCAMGGSVDHATFLYVLGQCAPPPRINGEVMTPERRAQERVWRAADRD